MVSCRRSGEICIILLLAIILDMCEGGQFQRLLNSGEEECDIDCSAEPEETICGSDGRLYRSQCEIERANCEGHPVSVKNFGKCPDASRCFMERKHAQEMARKPAAGIFIPECQEDGSYQDSQCHTGSGYCWCVDKQGKPIPGSSARFFRPNCQAYQNANSHKRTSRGRKARNSCTINERKEFNRNMIQIFASEYNRSRSSETDSPNIPWEIRVVNWKFGQLDINANQQLNKLELRDLRKMVRKIVRPKPCARTFTQYCDLDQDKVITRPEWEVCLDALQTDTTQTPPLIIRTTEQPPFVISTQLTTAPRTKFPVLETTSRPRVTKRRIPLSWRTDSEEEFTYGGVDLLQEVSQVNTTSKKKDPARRKRPNCPSEHSKAVMKQRRDPSAGTYVPSCDKAGNYAVVQCHPATGFCWCVDPENGRPIPQTSTHNAQPNCNHVAVRPLGGCPGGLKDQFLANLTKLLSAQMMESFTANRTSMVIDFRPSTDDAVKWKFRTLDLNANALIERSEWKTFKQYMLESENLRKCGRRLFKFCDADGNKKVSVEEWLRCTSVKTEPLRVPPKPRLRGPNPLDRFLKAD